jgi:hypothetical protein
MARTADSAARKRITEGDPTALAAVGIDVIGSREMSLAAPETCVQTTIGNPVALSATLGRAALPRGLIPLPCVLPANSCQPIALCRAT